MSTEKRNTGQFLKQVGPFLNPTQRIHRNDVERHLINRHSGGDAGSVLDNYKFYQGHNCNVHNPHVIETSGTRYQHSKQKHSPDELPNNSDSFEESALASARTIVRKHSAKDLRNIVKSQVSLIKTIDKGQKRCEATKAECSKNFARNEMKVNQVYSQYENGIDNANEAELLYYRPSETSSIGVLVDDVLTSKVINPMIRKIHKKFLNNVKEELSLMDDLAEMSQKVQDIYKAIQDNRRD